MRYIGNGAHKILPERKKELKGNIKEILSRIREKKDSISKRDSGDQVETQIMKKDNGGPKPPIGKVKNLVLDYERKRKEIEGNKKKEKTGKEFILKKSVKKNVTTNSISSPSMKKGLKSVIKPNQRTLVELWGPDCCKEGSPLKKKF